MALAIVAAAVFGLWFVLSVLNQFSYGRWIGRLKARDAAAFIPTWTFFAPRPGVSDFEILYRDRLDDGTAGPWRVLPRAPHGRWRWIWQPHKRREKLIVDCVLTLLPRYTPGRLDHLLDVPYLLLLSLVEAAPHDFRAQGTQFCIMSVTAGPPPVHETVFVSEFVRSVPAASRLLAVA